MGWGGSSSFAKLDNVLKSQQLDSLFDPGRSPFGLELPQHDQHEHLEIGLKLC